MIIPSDKFLAEKLVAKGYISQTDMDKCMSEVAPLKVGLGSFLVNYGFINEDQLLEAQAKVLNLEVVQLKTIKIDPAVLERIPVKFAWYYKFMPIKIVGKQIEVASASTLDVKIQDEIRVHLGLEPKVFLAKESEVIESLRKHYGLGADTINKIITKEASSGNASQEVQDVWVEDLEKETEDASVAKLVNQVFLDAFHKRATDIHIEPYRDKVRLRYRIDGVLTDANLPEEARHLIRPILSRIKIMANLSIEEKRLPQDGSAVVKTKDQDLDLRVSTIPTPRGESIVIRILRTKVMLYSLEKLGLEQSNLKIFQELVKKPHGIILATGPTGSGKTTTLYACLNAISSTEKKIITIEDPIEYEMEGITQIQVNSKVNLDFARGLRSVLRHDPDIIMVGEIRDFETAEIAIRTALTGHLVLSTLHTNDAASGITRLIDMGVEPFLVASSIEAFVAQRLVRVICPKCRMTAPHPMIGLQEEISRSLGLKKPSDATIYMGGGCAHCNHTGYYGRTAIYEVLTMNEEIRSAILEKRRSEEIKSIAVRSGMITLRQDGWKKVINGITTPDEVMNVTVKEETLDVSPEQEKAKTSSTPASNSSKPITVDEKKLQGKNNYDSRIYNRLDIEIPIRFQHMKKDPANPSFLTEDGIEHSTYTIDISAGGVRFRCGYIPDIGSIINIKIQLKDGERSINCLAKICRIEEDNIEGKFRVIAYFLDITSADRAKIDQFTKQNAGNK